MNFDKLISNSSHNNLFLKCKYWKVQGHGTFEYKNDFLFIFLVFLYIHIKDFGIFLGWFLGGGCGDSHVIKYS